MTVRAKTLGILAVTLAALALLLGLISRSIVLRSFAELEKEDARAHVERAVRSLSAELEDLLSFTSDEAWWDDTYEFVVDRNQDYVAKNLVDSTFSENRISVIVYLDRAAKVVWGEGYDLDKDERLPLPDGFEAHLGEGRLPALAAADPGGVAGVLRLSSTFLLFAAVPILTSEGEGPARGVMIMGRLLEGAELELFQERTRLEVSILPASEENPEATFRIPRITPGSEPVVVAESNETLAAYALVTDAYGEPAFLLRVDVARTIYGQGRRTVAYLFSALIASGLVLIGVAWLLLDRSVLAPLSRISAAVRSVRSTGDPSGRVAIEGPDELGRLAADINGMLASLERSRQLLRGRARLEQASELLDELPAYAYLKDTQGRYLRANRRFCEALGKTPEEVVARTEFDLFPAELAERHHRLELAVLRSGEASGVDVDSFRDRDRLVSVSTRLVPVKDASGATSGVVGLRFDITELKQAQERLARLATAVEHAAEAIVMTDAAGAIQYVNPAFLTMHDYSSQDVLGRNVREIESGRHPPEHYRKVWDCLERGQVWRGRFFNRKKDGALIEVDSAISPVRNEAGKVVGYVGVQRDVSRERDLERQLRQAQKLEALGTLAGGIAHDFNNILTPILFSAEMALGQAEPDSRLKRLLERIIRSSERARDLVQQVLAFSRQTEREPQVLRLSPILKESLKLLRASLPPTVELGSHIDGDEPPVRADPAQIHQVLVNLITNAAQAIGQGPGEIDVDLRTLRVDGHTVSRPSNLTDGTYVVVTVRDSGSGMSRLVKERALEPFFTTRPPGEGTGLGLSVVHGIVEGCGGAIDMESEPGRGTTVRVFFPAAREERPVAVEPRAGTVGGDERILCVDDEAAMVDSIRDVLESFGYRITGMTSPTEAIGMIRRVPQGFDLVITDQALSRMAGTDMVRKIREVCSQIPVIVLTSRDANVSPEEVQALGISRVIHKPLKTADLAQAVRKVLDTRV